MIKSLLVLLLYLPTELLAQTDLLRPQLELINTKIDSINITHFILNEPTNKNFRSKFKVLEFWATWCGPCLKAVPHINKLQEKFKDSNIVFLSFTYESPQKILQTLEKVNFETIVVSDTSKATHRTLRVEYNGVMPLPRTVLIDDKNKIVWYGSPQKLTAKVVEKFLTGKLLVE